MVNYAKSADGVNKVVESINKEGGDAIAQQANVSDTQQTIIHFDDTVAHHG